MTQRFTDHQIYIMKRLAHGVTKTEFWKWNQTQTRGLYMRMFFKFVNPASNNGIYAIVTQKGWNAVQEMNKPQYRKDPTRPIFKRESLGKRGSQSA